MKNAFLNGDLAQEVYMKIHPGFETPDTRHRICKLKKSLYGLKKFLKAWFERFTRVVQKHGYSYCQVDHMLFVKKSKHNKLSILIAYINSIIVIGDLAEELINLKKTLAKEFKIKKLGNLIYFLAMEVARSREEIYVSKKIHHKFAY